MRELRVRLVAAGRSRKPVLERLVQLYLYDFSDLEGLDVGRDGLFPSRSMDRYREEPDRFPYLVYVNGQIAGFVLINSVTSYCQGPAARSVAEFFALRQYRRRGVGTRAAVSVFSRFPGTWEVGVLASNKAAQAFWRKVIGDYTHGNYQEPALVADDVDRWGVVFCFNTAASG